MKNKSIPAFVLILSALILAGCNTTAGIGRDIKSTGNAIENSAEDSKPSNNY